MGIARCRGACFGGGHKSPRALRSCSVKRSTIFVSLSSLDMKRCHMDNLNATTEAGQQPRVGATASVAFRSICPRVEYDRGGLTPRLAH
jgi:hypothetical protein